MKDRQALGLSCTDAKDFVLRLSTFDSEFKPVNLLKLLYHYF